MVSCHFALENAGKSARENSSLCARYRMGIASISATTAVVLGLLAQWLAVAIATGSYSFSEDSALDLIDNVRWHEPCFIDA